MKNRISTITTLLTISLLLVTNILGIKADINTDNIFSIKSTIEWNQLASKCELDSYSNDLVVSLDADIDFEGKFSSIPYFNGTFNGNGHTLKGIEIYSSRINDGVFRITGKDSIINDLKIEMKANNSSSRFGVVGYNQGKINNISVNANIEAISEAGIVAGYNSVNGEIEKCSVSGVLTGQRYIGGIVGKNYGIIKSCTNNAKVNNEIKKEDLDISTISVESIVSTSDKTIISDVGSIAGTSFGTILECVNNATIGHEHIGYNVGGIAGSQSGFISDSKNNASIFGRKEIGGIVGQMQPAMYLIFQEDYLQKMSNQIKVIHNDVNDLADELKVAKDVNTDYVNGVLDNLNAAKDALELLLKDFWNTDKTKFNNAATALSGSISSAISTTKLMAEYNDGESNVVLEKIKNINDGLNELGDTGVQFADSLTAEKEVYKDISNLDTEQLTDGKVLNCINNATIDGDINAGGIAGAMSVENSMDPEDDIDIVGLTSLDASYKVRAVIDKCTNNGSVVIKRNNAGGICGNEKVGLIKNSINYGMLDCDGCDYIGGIVGISSSYIKNNFAKCFVYGHDYVGGIAGSAIKGENNGSLAQIVEYSASAGAIFGNYGDIENDIVENSSEIKDNWYIYDDLAAIDGISYAKKAYPVSVDEVLEYEIDNNLKKVNVIFMDGDEIVFKKTLEYGETMSEKDVPDFVVSNNEYRIWDNYDSKKLQNITKDILFVCSYSDVYPSISTNEEPIPYVVVTGEFQKNDNVIVNVTTENPTNTQNEFITYHIYLAMSNNSSVSGYRLYANDFDKYKVYAKIDDTWSEVEYETDGRYVSISCIDSDTISIVKVEDNSIYTIIVVGVIVVIIVLFFVIKKKNRNKKH